MKWEDDPFVKPTAFKHIVLCSFDHFYNNSCIEKVLSLCSKNEQRVEHYVLTPTTAEFYMTQILTINTYVKSDEYHQITALFCFHL